MTHYAIPDRLNLLIAGAVVITASALAGLASQLSLLWSIPLGILFSFVLLTNYALIHEAAHDMLHSRARINWFVGMLLSWFFPSSFTVLKTAHIVHHRCNRTDHEMFDGYYAGDIRSLKFVQWYGIMLGLWWPLIPLGNLILALIPGLLGTPPFRKARCTSIVFDDFDQATLWKVRLEVALAIVFWVSLYHLLDLRWQTLAVFYAFFAFNWSTRQYVTHAFTPRDVRDGALNLKVSRPLSWILLQGQWDLVHHQHPHASWIHLQKLAAFSKPPISYWRQYLKLWKGPRLYTEPGPAILPKQDYLVMD
ncbi:MAG: fatty acid desaturase [Gammaproteobacteria bacterium]|nr:fatty acid desaturase [Gammaproteobacteria bacterium]